MSEQARLELGIPEPTTRRCTKCGVVRPLGMFYLEIERRRAEREGRKRWHAPCRYCQRERIDRIRKDRREYVDRLKLETGCTDCGIRIPHPEVYDFDHLPGHEKVKSVSIFLTTGTWEQLIDEIAKCEVVCANCHRIRTRSRGDGTFGKSRIQPQEKSA